MCLIRREASTLLSPFLLDLCLFVMIVTIRKLSTSVYFRVRDYSTSLSKRHKQS